MAQTAAIVSALKNALKEQGITYQQVAEALDLSEASVKRLFSERQFSLQRLDQICSLLGLEISDLVRRLDQAQRIDALTAEQEQELVQVQLHLHHHRLSLQLMSTITLQPKGIWHLSI